MKAALLFAKLLILGCLLLSPIVSHAQHFTINDFRADIVIDEDGSFTVSEYIAVDFHREKHGIYREIPFRYEDELGRTVLMPIDVISVTDGNGNRLTSKTSKTGNVVNIRIGDADKYVRGEQEYRIVYRVENGLLYFEDHDELYWNVTGNFWLAEIEQVSAQVTINTPSEIRNMDFSCYTGEFGSKKSDCYFESSENGGKFYSTAPLNPNEGMTIAFSFDKGIVAEPSDFERSLLALNLPENWGFILPIISFFFMFSHWKKKGRDPKVREATVVKYNPPEVNGRELTAAEVGTLIDENLDPRDISATMVGLAVKGYLKIEEVEMKILVFSRKDYKLTALKTEFQELTEFEQWLMAGLFQNGKTEVLVSDLKNKFYKYLPKLSKAIYKQLVSHRFFATSPQQTVGRYMGYGALVLILAGVSQLISTDFSLQPKLIIISILTAMPFFLFSKAMPAKTRQGALALADVLGFQEFLERAEKDKLERMEDKDLFSKYLPYAIALDVVDRWAKAFEGIEQNMPAWYVGAHGMTHFHPVAFSDAINTTTSHLSTATFSAPRSSGSSGGGSSGGGGGGGGGGSW
ncbi:MAG: DUF2207 domain-containing protein [bacterium]|nr:DUF2207 domain-containing protein [bacterium]